MWLRSYRLAQKASPKQHRQPSGDKVEIRRKPQPPTAASERVPGCAACAAGEGPCPACAEAAGGVVQPKLVVGGRNDPAEAAADRMADEAIQSSPRPRYGLHGNDAPGSAQQSVPDSMRRYFEPLLGEKLSQVTLHTDGTADRNARSLNARAFAMGNDIAFAAGELQPESRSGQHLLAHELAHVVQQQGGSDHPVIRRSPGGKRFDLATSGIGKAITTQLSSEDLSILVPVPGANPPDYQRQQLLNPGQVLELLATSASFLGIAGQVDRTFFGPGASEHLLLNFRRQAELGTEYERRPRGEPSRINVYVDAGESPAQRVATVVRGIVHEVVHASHRGEPMVRSRGLGPVAQVEARGVAEESRTRAGEYEIMDQITASAPWATYCAGAALPRAGESAREVRSSFVSGWPKLTYQEFFIIEGLKAMFRPAGGDDRQAARAARLILDEGGLPSVAPGQGTRFFIDWQAIRRPPSRFASGGAEAEIQTHGTRVTTALPPLPPSLDQAIGAVEVFNRHRRRLGAAEADLRQLHPGCVDFIRFASEDPSHWYRIEITTGLDPRSEAGRGIVLHLRSRMQEIHDRAASAQTASRVFLEWYTQQSTAGREQAPPLPTPGALPRREERRALGERESQAQEQRQTLRYFGWVLVAEQMAREWEPYTTVDPTIQERHLLFLEEAAGRGSLGGSISGRRGMLTGVPHQP